MICRICDFCFFFFKQKTAYEMRISDWSSDVCSSDLDAIVIDAAWPRLADEVACYLDYCRIRRIEAELRECDVSQFTFGRADWEQARRAESAWTEHCRACGQRSYLPAPPPRHFRVC